jgi:hypothetical protein
MRMSIPRALPRLALAAALGLLAAGCAGTVDAGPALAAGAASVEAAQAAGPEGIANRQLGAARAKLERAELLQRGGNGVDALRLAEQADLDAQLARATAGTERSQRSADAAQAALDALRAQLAPRPADAPAR